MQSMLKLVLTSLLMLDFITSKYLNVIPNAFRSHSPWEVTLCPTPLLSRLGKRGQFSSNEKDNAEICIYEINNHVNDFMPVSHSLFSLTLFETCVNLDYVRFLLLLGGFISVLTKWQQEMQWDPNYFAEASLIRIFTLLSTVHQK